MALGIKSGTSQRPGRHSELQPQLLKLIRSKLQFQLERALCCWFFQAPSQQRKFLWMPFIQLLRTASAADKVAGENKAFIHCWWLTAQPLWKSVWRFLKKLNYPTAGYTPKGNAGHIKHICIPMITAAPFTIVKRNDQPANMWMDQENMIYVHKGISFNQREDWNHVICRKIDGTKDPHIKWNKSDTEGQVLYISSHM